MLNILKLKSFCLVSFALVACSNSSNPVSPDAEMRMSGSPGAAEQAQSNKSTIRFPVLKALNDTGIVFGGDYPKGINDDCSGAVDPSHHWAENEEFSELTYRGQDCEWGRDVTDPDNEDGHAGFSYLKISDSGLALDPSAAQWSCVLDQVSGLMWEVKKPGNQVKADGGLHDADDVYSWYSNDWDINGGAVGNWGRHNALCSGYTNGESSTYCNTESFVNRVNANGLCSFTDWRIPTVAELNSLVNFGVTEPAIDQKFFPNTQGAPYWSSSLIADSTDRARYVNFRFGQTIWSPRREFYRIRLVRDIESREGE